MTKGIGIRQGRAVERRLDAVRKHPLRKQISVHIRPPFLLAVIDDHGFGSHAETYTRMPVLGPTESYHVCWMRHRRSIYIRREVGRLHALFSFPFFSSTHTNY